MPENDWHDLDISAEQGPGLILGATVGGTDLAVVRFDGGWRAFEDTCTHEHCPFTVFGEVEDGVLICNCHGAEFDLATGAVLLDPAEAPLRLFEVREQAGSLQVQLAATP